MSRALGPPALALWNVGGLGVLVFGVWLALEVDGYELWDGWIIAAMVLWSSPPRPAGGSGPACARASRSRRIDGAGVMVGVMALATLRCCST